MLISMKALKLKIELFLRVWIMNNNKRGLDITSMK